MQSWVANPNAVCVLIAFSFESGAVVSSMRTEPVYSRPASVASGDLGRPLASCYCRTGASRSARSFAAASTTARPASSVAREPVVWPQSSA